MKTTSFVTVTLLIGLAGPAFAQDQSKESVKSFTYKKTKQTDLQIHVHYPPDWKKDDTQEA